ncbi:hypothetical protein B0H16DRAFT_1792274 [Mycena metata]|uniref:Uncharacterized protein n=1 Tax=Mycena metata TaxID=1033252 RepID=A0AAD7HIG3_9AGAR|nr:hypothetical protein B0H16DRAFT_1792274 [Mycena metata]
MTQHKWRPGPGTHRDAALHPPPSAPAACGSPTARSLARSLEVYGACLQRPRMGEGGGGPNSAHTRVDVDEALDLPASRAVAGWLLGAHLTHHASPLSVHVVLVDAPASRSRSCDRGARIDGAFLQPRGTVHHASLHKRPASSACPASRQRARLDATEPHSSHTQPESPARNGFDFMRSPHRPFSVPHILFQTPTTPPKSPTPKHRGKENDWN